MAGKREDPGTTVKAEVALAFIRGIDHLLEIACVLSV